MNPIRRSWSDNSDGNNDRRSCQCFRLSANQTTGAQRARLSHSRLGKATSFREGKKEHMQSLSLGLGQELQRKKTPAKLRRFLSVLKADRWFDVVVVKSQGRRNPAVLTAPATSHTPQCHQSPVVDLPWPSQKERKLHSRLEK